MTEVGVTMEYPPTLWRFRNSDAFVRVIVGPVGSGKSSASIIEIVMRATQQRPSPDGIRRTRFAIIRNTYRELQDTTRKTFEQWVPADLGRWYEQDFTFEIKFADVHCEVLFRALDRPEDIKKLLSLEITGAYVNEIREIPKHVFDVLQTRVGRFPSRLQGGPTWFGLWADTNPWHDGHWAQELFAQNLPGFELYRQPGGRAPGAENVENLPPGYYDRLVIGKDSEWVRVYVDGLDASGAIGAVYGDLLTKLQQRGNLAEFEHPTDGILTSWDLGVSDSTAIWFWRVGPKGIDFIDHYEAHGQPLSHFFDVVDQKKYTYVRHCLPHDARARSLQTGVSTLDQFTKRYPAKVAITPQLSVADGIAAARWLLEQDTRFHPRCEDGVKCLRAYRYEFDEVKQVFSKNPVHDFSSHTADSLRYAALVVQKAQLVQRRKDERANPPPPKPIEVKPITMDPVPFEIEPEERRRV